MTEAEWLTRDDSECVLDLLEALRYKGSARKRRLYACSLARYRWNALTDPSRKAIAVAERYADGLASEQDLVEAEKRARAAYGRDWQLSPGPGEPAVQAAKAACYCCVVKGYDPSANVAWYESREDESAVLEIIRMFIEGPGYVVVGLEASLRDIFGNPFRPVTLDPAWLTTTVVRMAQAANEEGHLAEGTLDVVRLGILADALEEAGCTDAEVLSHCRGPGPHVRGCWVLDLLLGKA
jgi:hypothetical protein